MNAVDYLLKPVDAARLRETSIARSSGSSEPIRGRGMASGFARRHRLCRIDAADDAATDSRSQAR